MEYNSGKRKYAEDVMNVNAVESQAGMIPIINPDLIEIDGKNRPRFRIGRCQSCGTLSFPASPVCGSCLSEDIGKETVEGSGELYAYSVVHQAPKGWVVPYALGYVDLPNGLRILGHIESDFERLRSGLPVELALGVVRHAPDGSDIQTYVFTPVE
jgi:uncharacterized OB-fold protein